MRRSIVTGVAVLAALALPMVAGAANKLVVNGTDGVTPKMVVTDEGQVGAGTSTPAGQLDVSKAWGGKATTNLLSVYTSYGDASRLTVRSAEGTQTSPTKTLFNTTIGNINFRGHDGTNFSNNGVAVIAAAAEADFTSSSQPTRLQFLTTSAAGVTSEKLRISADGRLRLSNQPTAPANNAACTVGDLIFDAPNGYLYLCVATNSWKRTSFVAY